MGEGPIVNPKLRFERSTVAWRREMGLEATGQGPGPELWSGGVTAGHSPDTSGIRPLLPMMTGSGPASLSPWVLIRGVPVSLPHLCSQLLLWGLSGEPRGTDAPPSPSFLQPPGGCAGLPGAWEGGQREESTLCIAVGRTTQQRADKHPPGGTADPLSSRHHLPWLH